MPNYTLTYFEARGFAEDSRQLFHLSDTPYVDNRIQRERWGEFKSMTPFEKVPVLEIDGKVLPQSFAIARYLAREFGFAGRSNLEAAWIDAYADQFKDYLEYIRPFFRVAIGASQGDFEQLKKEFAEPNRDKFFGFLEKLAKDNGLNGNFVGDSLTWFDLLIADHILTMENFVPGFLDAFPCVLETRKKIVNTPKLKEWIDKRPVTRF